MFIIVGACLLDCLDQGSDTARAGMINTLNQGWKSSIFLFQNYDANDQEYVIATLCSIKCIQVLVFVNQFNILFHFLIHYVTSHKIVDLME